MSSDPTMQDSQKIDNIPRLETLGLGLMVVLVVLNFRGDFHAVLPLLWLDSFLVLAFPIAVFCWLLKASDGKMFEGKRWLYTLQTIAVLFGCLPALLQPVYRSMGAGEPFEIVVLCMVTNISWFLTVFSRVASFERTSFMIGAALVLFTCFMSQQNSVFAFAFIYAMIALWWLFGNYWNKVSTKAIDGQTRTLPVRGLAVLLSTVVLVVVGAITTAVLPGDQLASLRGFMPTSGGDSWGDEFARSGIGDGDMLTAGPNATTTGAVDSDQFIEDDRPSMYDITADKFDGPLKIKQRRTRAQALNETAKHMHQVIQSEQKGRSFRTVRESKSDKVADLENRITDALFFVEGEVPARFGVDCFHHFDGWDWSKVDIQDSGIPNPRISLKKGIQPWYEIQNASRQFLESKRAHRVKIMRLETSALPAPPMLKSWHIHRVETENMFLWNEQGIVRMQGEFIPPHAMIDMFSKVPNYYVLESAKNPNLSQPNQVWEWIDSWLGAIKSSGSSRVEYDPFDTNPDSPYVQIPENESRSRISKLAKEWTDGLKPGWSQVDAIVTRLRTEFDFDPEMTASDDGRDSVSCFLDQQGGPSYLFATAAAQILRSAGYRTRLMRGFLLQDEDYDRIARQSYATSDNLHMWPEVCIDGTHWIPVEPTPGFPQPVNTFTAWQWVKSRIADGFVWALHHPLISLTVITLLGLCVWFRRELIALGCWFAWLGSLMLSPGRRLKATRRLIDARFWAAGLPRPASSTIESWCAKVDETEPLNFFDYWCIASFSSKSNRLNTTDVRNACKQVASEFSFKKIRDYAKSNSKRRTFLLS